MASVSSASGLGNTALRGFGGLASGLDRDALIEQMTMGTQNKIDRIESDKTELGWKQEAYQNIADMILELQEEYFTYASANNLTDSSIFGKNQITTVGSADSAKLVTATGHSEMLEYLSILGVKQLASSAIQQSKGVENGSITMDRSNFDDNSMVSSNLEGLQIRFATWHAGSGDEKGYYENKVTFTLPSSYTDEKGNTQKIDYTAEPEILTAQLQKALEQSNIKMGEEKLSDLVEFKFQGGKLNINKKEGAKFDVVIQEGSSALAGLGYQESEDGEREEDGISLEEYNANLNDFSDSYLKQYDSAAEYLKGKKLSISFNGTSKEIELVTEEEYEGNPNLTVDQIMDNVQKRLDSAFGKDQIKVNVDPEGIKFTTTDENDTMSMSSSDGVLLTNLGLKDGASNRLNLKGGLDQENLGLENIGQYADEEGNLELTINGKKIEGLTTDSTLQEIMDAINQTEGVGVKATYVSATGQFSLISTETGKGRQIELGDSGLAHDLFGSGAFKEGQDAIIRVSYGNGMEVDINRSSNTFDLEGLTVSVTGTFGYTPIIDKVTGEVTGYEFDKNSGKAVSFSGSADVDGVTEKVSKFIEAYNKLVTEVNTQVTTKPDSSYGPLTDAQKDEMTDEEIERWEEKAKEGIIFGDSVMRDLSMNLQNVLVSMVSENGMNLQDLEDIGITVSSDYLDGGTIVFDEAKFRDAMKSDPDRVGEIFAGGNGVKKGLAEVVEDTLTPYATKYSSQNGGSYGRLVAVAGSEKIPLSITDNQIYKELKTMQENIETLREQLKSEQDRYISQFARVETLISQMNSQSSWLSSLQ